MTFSLLSDLAHLFSLEALRAERFDEVEANRLWDISIELHARAESVHHHEVVAALEVP